MDYSDQEPCKLHLMVARGAERTLSPQIPPLPGCRYESHVPIDTERHRETGDLNGTYAS